MGSVWRVKFFNARPTVPDPISSCCAIALTLMPRRRSLTTSSQSNTFLGRPPAVDFVPCLWAPFKTRHYSLSQLSPPKAGATRMSYRALERSF
jgi:hypothetical protein